MAWMSNYIPPFCVDAIIIHGSWPTQTENWKTSFCIEDGDQTGAKIALWRTASGYVLGVWRKARAKNDYTVSIYSYGADKISWNWWPYTCIFDTL